MPDRVESYYVPKKLIGELTRVLITSTDPAHILEFTPSLISSCRALMMSMLEDNQPAPTLIAGALESILEQMILIWNERETFTVEELAEFNKMLTDVFKSEGNARWGLALYRDILLCDSMFDNWESANREYIKDHNSWNTSNAILVQIHKVLFRRRKYGASVRRLLDRRKQRAGGHSRPTGPAAWSCTASARKAYGRTCWPSRARHPATFSIGSSVPGTVGTSARRASCLPAVLEPIISMVSGEGPMKVMPASAHARGSSIRQEPVARMNRVAGGQARTTVHQLVYAQVTLPAKALAR